MGNIRRPILRKINLEEALNSLRVNTGKFMTFSVGQWDEILKTAYEAGWVLIEVNNREVPIAAYQIEIN